MYLISRAVSVVLGLTFSLFYSRTLGPENRGILTAVFLATVFFSQIINGGLDLSFRSRLSGLDPSKNAFEYSVFSLLSSLTIALFTDLVLMIYSRFKVEVSHNFIIITTIYCFLAVLSEQITQFLLSMRRFDALWKIEIVTIPLQITCFISLHHLNYFSTSVCVLLSFSISYLIIIVRLIWYVRKHVNFENSKIFYKLHNLFTVSKINLGYNLCLSLLDRIDRILILLIFTNSDFGKYSLVTGVIVATRVFPETIGQLILGKKLKQIQHILKPFTNTLLILTILLPCVISLMLQLIIKNYFGEIWYINPWVVILFAYSELIRGTYLIQISQILEGGKQHKIHLQTAILTLFITLVTGLLAATTHEIITVPAGLLVGYLVSNIAIKLWLRSTLKKKKY